jgi:hypothetical protein
VGKSSHGYDKGVPKKRVTNDDDDGFDWRSEIHRIKTEDELEIEKENSILDEDSKKASEQEELDAIDAVDGYNNNQKQEK